MVLKGEVCPCCGRRLPETADAKIARITAPARASWGADDCWLWPARVDASGYGYVEVYVERRLIRVRSHRHAYEQEHGPIPAGMGLLHTCDVRYTPGDITYRRCGNPAHLRPDTQSANIAHMWAAGRGARGPRKTFKGSLVPHALLDEAKVAEMRRRYLLGETTTELGAAFGVSQDAAASAIYGRTWAHVPGAVPHPGRGFKRHRPQP